MATRFIGTLRFSNHRPTFRTRNVHVRWMEMLVTDLNVVGAGEYSIGLPYTNVGMLEKESRSLEDY